ncbi:MAG: alkaline phosphatase family protein [Acidobacteria bacterium]|nr:alkaline phosphatase family protein [Acidobacteriota bacterium]
MTNFIRISSLFFLSFLFFSASAQQPEKQDAKPKYEKVSSHVILITVSGLGAEELNDSEINKLRLPAIRTLRDQGSRAISVESIYPSQVIPAHATIATGAFPADHGITSDYPFNEKLGTQSPEPFILTKDLKGDTIWEIAKRAGLTTAAVGYPLTAGAAIDFNLPVLFDTNFSSETKSVLQLFSNQYVNPQNLTAQLSPLLKSDGFKANDKLKDISVQLQLDHYKALAAAYLIENYRPNLLLINFQSFSSAERRYGRGSREAFSALESIDEHLKRIVDSTERAGLAVTFLIVTDFGSMRTEQIFKPNVLLEKKGWLTTGNQGQITSWRVIVQALGGSAAVFVKDNEDQQFISDVEKFFRDFHEKPDSPIWRVIPRHEASKLGADPRAAFYLDAAPDYAFSSGVKGSRTNGSPERAGNGYLPSRSEIRASLIISGKGISQGEKINYVRLIDIAPTIARLFGQEMRTARGRVLSEVIDK